MSDSSTTNQPAQPALDFKSAMLYAVRVVLRSAQMAELAKALDQRMADAGSFFENEPVVIDATAIDEPLDWASLCAILHSHALHPIGVVAHGENLALAQACGLTAVDLSNAPVRPANPTVPDKEIPSISSPAKIKAATAQRQAPPPPPDADAAVAPAAMVIDRSLRSGQRIYARHTDLIVIGAVNQGAEIIADGNIHVYGPLRGKAMAGARGDVSARIFATQMDAELVAIAGVYRVIETKLDPTLYNQPTIVHLTGERLQLTRLNT